MRAVQFSTAPEASSEATGGAMAAAASDPALDASVGTKAEAFADVETGKGGRKWSAGAGATIRPGAVHVLLGFLLGFAAAIICDFKGLPASPLTGSLRSPGAKSSGRRLQQLLGSVAKFQAGATSGSAAPESTGTSSGGAPSASVQGSYDKCDSKSQCTATDEEMKKYLAYTPRAPCPDDWLFVQHLIFKRNCFCLPRRQCFTPIAPDYKENTIPFPDSVFNQEVLNDRSVRWDGMFWPNFASMNNRTRGDCLGCWNMTTESWRWMTSYHGLTPSMNEVLAMKPKGSLKIGLDAGGGTGSFAAKMAERGITIVTTAMNTETLPTGRPIHRGLPYMQTIALRGLIPLHIPHQVRQPFFDGTLDVIHAASTIKYVSIPDFETLMFEWDRILRPGGIMWFELFYAPVEEMPKYLDVMALFQYKRLYWNIGKKEDMAEHEGPHLDLSCVLEKPYKRD